MKRVYLLLYVCFPVFSFSQTDSIKAGVYNWEEPTKMNTTSTSTILFEGSTHDMEVLQVSSNIYHFSAKKKKYAPIVPIGREDILIIKSGTMQVIIKDSSYTVTAGSIIFLEGEKKFVYKLQNDNNTTCSFYLIKYISRLGRGEERGKIAGVSQVINWDTVAFKPGEKGGRRNFLERSTALCKRLEIHATTLKQNLQSHAPHRHTAAEFTIIKEGEVQMQIGDKIFRGAEGSIFYAPSNVLHALQNIGTGNCTYFAIQFE